MCRQHFLLGKNLFVVARRVSSDLSCFMSLVAIFLHVFADLLAAWTARVEIFPRVAFDFRRSASPGLEFVSQLRQSEHQGRLINGCRKLLAFKQTPGLQGSHRAVVSLGHVEDDGVCVKLWRRVSVHWTGRVMLERRRYKLAGGLSGMVAADTRLSVPLKL